MKDKKWIAFFSQTGSEIVEIIKHTGRVPDVIITNRSIRSIEQIHVDLLHRCFDRIVFIPSKPTSTEYRTAIGEYHEDDIITLHGYLRVIPKDICESYKIYNGHPGDIIRYPELKGFNPQEKAFNSKLLYSGCVIHRVTEQVDDGEILMSVQCPISTDSLEEVYSALHTFSVNLWVEFVKKYIILSV